LMGLARAIRKADGVYDERQEFLTI